VIAAKLELPLKRSMSHANAGLDGFNLDTMLSSHLLSVSYTHPVGVFVVDGAGGKLIRAALASKIVIRLCQKMASLRYSLRTLFGTFSQNYVVKKERSE
jgi:hypothetical protein